MLLGTASCLAQGTEVGGIRDKRWSLLPDSTVKGIHYNDLVHMEGARRTYIMQRDSLRTLAQACGSQVSALKNLVANYKRGEEEANLKLDLVTEDNFRISRELRTAEYKIAALGPWATVGKVGTWTLGLGVAGFGIAKGIQAIHGR